MKAPSYRVLLVMDTIGAHGPINLNALCDRLPGVSRAGIWRAAVTLRDYGWVGTRLADNAYELTANLDLGLANAHFAHELTERAVEEIQKSLAQGARDVTAGTFVAPGQFEIIETTQTNAQIAVPLSLVFDEYAQEAQSQMDSVLLLKHLTAYLKRTDTSAAEADLIRTGQHVNDLHAIRNAAAQSGKWVSTHNGEFFVKTYE